MQPIHFQQASEAGGGTASLGLAEVVQLTCLGKKTGRMVFSCGEQVGVLFFQHGQLLHAETGLLQGPEAVYAMLQWPTGSFVLEESVLPQQRTIHQPWEQLLLEGANLSQQPSVPSQPAGLNPAYTTAAVTTSKVAGTQPRIVVVKGPRKGESFELAGEFTHIGRVPGNDIVLEDATISSKHCALIHHGPDIVLQDLHSSNGTFVNDQPITEKVLELGDRIRLGDVELIFESGIRRPKLDAKRKSQADGPPITSAVPAKAAFGKIVSQPAGTVVGSSSQPIVYQDFSASNGKQTTSVRPAMLLALIIFSLLAALAIVLVLRAR